MSSAQVVDGESRARQLDRFFAEGLREKRQRAEQSARKATADVVKEANRDPGKVLAHPEFIWRLQAMNPSLSFEQTVAYPEQGGIYVRNDGANLDDPDPRYRGRSFVTGMSWGMMPENTTITLNPDAHGEPKPRIARKGWRDTLKVLIQLRLLTLDAVERAFGSGGENWHRQLH